ncbi:PepSY domain-containing protein [Calothrix sp. PCC 7507]|uniref:PepSY-associated TM helix domain-containing protein n=1 Tax=Calothrix sp. PCC 7507 TaxID=99598 RepID=UPI00029EDCF9|nr:PepSY-associated TM helix domain-containing protein [Calothrix sp. PCC 7507]AFY31692.1 Propeptide PepSY amd peptidase M4 [Calothrix sp. PCC 7507]
MKSQKIRNLSFYLHRYIGLFVGLILIIIGLTGSLLVFEQEINRWQVSQQFGQVSPQEQRVSMETILNNVKTTYANQPELKLRSMNMLPKNSTYTVYLKTPNDAQINVFVNPYSGAIMGDRQWESSFWGIVFKLHYALLAGRTGEIIVGIAALLLLILSITGIILWPGWRRLINGFKIKWQAHPKRVNFDIHKVFGIITAVFLGLIAFTGFCWNFYDFTKPAIYAVTSTPNLPEPISKPVTGKPPLGLAEILQKADAALPGAVTTYITFPSKPEDAFAIYKKQPQESNDYGDSAVYLDQFSGAVLRLQNGLSLPLGDRVLNSFTPLHYGTFWGLPTRILYVFVGLAPLILSVTGWVMWSYRRRLDTLNPTDTLEPLQR